MSDDDAAKRVGSCTVTPTTGYCSVVGYPVALILNSEGRVEVNDFSGVANGQLNADGTIEVTIHGKLRRGTANEESVLKILRAAIAVATGAEVSIEAGEDHRGEDGRLTVGGLSYAVQIVTVPVGRDLGKEIASGNFNIWLTDESAVSWISDAIEHKLTIAVPDRPRIVLALDARHVGILSDQSIVEKVRVQKPEIVSYGFAQIWLVGPITSRCVQIA